MADNRDPQKPPNEADAREARLKSALKANLARRKAQSRARSTDTGSHTGNTGPTGQDKDA